MNLSANCAPPFVALGSGHRSFQDLFDVLRADGTRLGVVVVGIP